MTYEEVRELFDCDPDTGKLFYKEHRSSKCRIGDSPSRIAQSGYVMVEVDGKAYRVHRLIWLWYYGYLPENDIDHINGDRSDNRILNLREVSRSCNLYNKHKRNRVSNTGIPGVYLNKDRYKYEVKISKDNKSIHLGLYLDLTEAVAHRLAGEQALGIDFYTLTPAKIYMNNYLEKTIEGI